MFLNSFLEFNVFPAKFVCRACTKLPMLPLLVGYLFIEVYFVCGGMFFFYFYIVRAVESLGCSNLFV